MNYKLITTNLYEDFFVMKAFQLTNFASEKILNFMKNKILFLTASFPIFALASPDPQQPHSISLFI